MTTIRALGTFASRWRPNSLDVREVEPAVDEQDRHRESVEPLDGRRVERHLATARTPLVRRLDHRPQEPTKSGGQSFDRLVDAGTPQGELEVGERLDVAGGVDLLVALLDRLVVRRHRDVEAADPGRELDEGRNPVWATHREVERDLAAL